MTSASKSALELSMSALSALYAIRTYGLTHPEATLGETIESLRRSDADMSAVDFGGAVAFHNALDLPTPDAPAGFFRATLTAWINHAEPWWLRLFPYGRERVLAALTPDEIQCFRAATLLQDPPETEICEWWDQLANLRRAAENTDLTEQGREAERWSLEFERERLSALGIQLRPKWVAIENNGAGFDIQSYDKGQVEPVARLIEVKSSTQSPPRMILTRNEWETANRFGERYFFHVWSVPAKKLKVLSSAEVEPHIPHDNGTGKWSEAVIPVP